MNKVDITIWGREFELNVSYDQYPGEKILEEQEKTLKTFCKSIDAIDSSKAEVEKYILKNGLFADSVDNIFKYVMPKSIYIPRTKNGIIAILCDFKFDDENGIAIVFENCKFKEIGTDDIIL